MTKPIIRGIIIVSLATLTLAGTVSAQGVEDRVAGFCTGQADRSVNISTQFSNRRAAYTEAVNKQFENQNKRRSEMDEKLVSARAKADFSRTESYRLLEERQTSDINKQLARDFAQEVDAAIVARRQAYDTARTEFRLTIDGLLKVRDAEMVSAINDFQNSSSAAIDAASKFCNGRVTDNAAQRRQLVDQLKTARLDFAEKLRTRQDFREGVRQAIEKRNLAFSEATAEFQRTMQTVRERYSALR